MALHWLDYLIFAAFLLICLGIGFFHSLTGGRQRTTEEFIMANRSLGVLPTVLSLLVSYQSAIVVLGMPAEVYKWGVQLWPMRVLYAFLACLIAERFIVPWLYPLQLTSINAYLEMRFASKAVRILGSILSILNAVLYMGIAIYTPSIALELATGFPAQASIPIMAVICTGYTALGGMKAVIWTDVFQFFVMLGGMLAILIKAMILAGGAGNAFDLAGKFGRLQWIDWSPDPTVRHTFWGFVFGAVPNWVLMYSLTQASVQRFSATKTQADARRTLLLNIPALVLVTSVAGLSGVAVLAYYAVQQCDPLASGQASSANQILPLFVKQVFADASGFNGLFLATLYSGALSSVSSSLSGAAANTWEDILKGHLVGISDTRATFINKALVVIYGAVSVGLAFLAATMPGPVTQIAETFRGAVGGPLLGLFLLGGIFKFVEFKGALAGGVTGLLAGLWLSFGSRTVSGHNQPLPALPTEGCPAVNVTQYDVITYHTSWGNNRTEIFDVTTELPDVQGPVTLNGIEKFYGLSYLWFATYGAVVCMVVAIVVSLIANRIKKNEAPAPSSELLIPWRQALSVECLCSWQRELDLRQGEEQAARPDTPTYELLDCKSDTSEVDIVLYKPDSKKV